MKHAHDDLSRPRAECAGVVLNNVLDRAHRNTITPRDVL
jgi:hypothetical protein